MKKNYSQTPKRENGGRWELLNKFIVNKYGHPLNEANREVPKVLNAPWSSSPWIAIILIQELQSTEVSNLNSLWFYTKLI